MTPKVKTVAASVGLLAVMLGLTAASVPLYRLFCQVTGYGGTPRTGLAVAEHESERALEVRFDTNGARGLPVTFRPAQPTITVRLGETVLTSFVAENTSDQPITTTALFNVTPEVAGSYVSKIECFCFSEQTFAPGERVVMPLSFFVDPKLAEYTQQGDITTITLSYTMFRSEKPEGKGGRT